MRITPAQVKDAANHAQFVLAVNDDDSPTSNLARAYLALLAEREAIRAKCEQA